jgi:hypothetical protein
VTAKRKPKAAAPPNLVEPLPKTLVDPAPQALREGTWAGLLNYECTRCGFKTLDREEALEHVLLRHGIKEEAT